MTLLLQPDHSKPWFWQLKLLPFVWLGGLFLGLVLHCKAASNLFFLMRGSVSVSIVGCLFFSIFPFLVSVLAVIIHRPCIILAVVFLKGCFFAYISIGFLSGLGNGSWLIRLVFMLSDILGIPLLYCFWRRCLRFGGFLPAAEVFLWFCAQIMIIGMDYHVIFPLIDGLNIL